jgi:hypothetical protein
MFEVQRFRDWEFKSLIATGSFNNTLYDLPSRYALVSIKETLSL